MNFANVLIRRIDIDITQLTRSDIAMMLGPLNCLFSFTSKHLFRERLVYAVSALFPGCLHRSERLFIRPLRSFEHASASAEEYAHLPGTEHCALEYQREAV